MEENPPPDESNPPPREPVARNIVLVGFMATGKSTIGKLVARQAGYRFIDCDHEIARRAGCPIPEIFAGEGEDGFRRRESEVLRALAGSERAVIATGGGVVTRPENHSLLRALGFVVWLHTKKRAILQRVLKNPHRPLLQTADPLATIRELLKQRKPLYRQVADLKVKTTTLTPREISAGILESASWFFAGREHVEPAAAPGSGGPEAGNKKAARPPGGDRAAG
jgi:shikimate kinase